MVATMMNRLALAYAGSKARARREDGQALVEYALIVSLIAVAAVAVLQLTGTSIVHIFNSIQSDL
jgi:Flp pilus assembly pilin Flp